MLLGPRNTVPSPQGTTYIGQMPQFLDPCIRSPGSGTLSFEHHFGRLISHMSIVMIDCTREGVPAVPIPQGTTSIGQMPQFLNLSIQQTRSGTLCWVPLPAAGVLQFRCPVVLCSDSSTLLLGPRNTVPSPQGTTSIGQMPQFLDSCIRSPGSGTLSFGHQF